VIVGGGGGGGGTGDFDGVGEGAAEDAFTAFGAAELGHPPAANGQSGKYVWCVASACGFALLLPAL
jgi:hypothetical protein